MHLRVKIIVFWFWKTAEACFRGYNCDAVTIGAGNELAPNRWQANTWTDDDSDPCQDMVSLGHNEFIQLTKLFHLGDCVSKTNIHIHQLVDFEYILYFYHMFSETPIKICTNVSKAPLRMQTFVTVPCGRWKRQPCGTMVTNLITVDIWTCTVKVSHCKQ